MSQERIARLKNALLEAVDLAQNRNLRPEDLTRIEALWKEQETFLEKVDSPTMQEMLINLEIILTAGSHLGQCIRRLQANTNIFSPTEFAAKLKAQVTEDEELDWLKLADNAVRVINRAPGIATLLGTFAVNEAVVAAVEKKKKGANRVTKDELMEMQTPDQVEHIEQDDESVDAKVRHIMRILREWFHNNGQQPISFYKFVLHPQSFTATVENIFYISFIIRDGLACLNVKDDEFVISPTEEEASQQQVSQVLKNQMVFSISMEEWQTLVTQYNMQEPSIRWG